MDRQRGIGHFDDRCYKQARGTKLLCSTPCVNIKLSFSESNIIISVIQLDLKLSGHIVD